MPLQRTQHNFHWQMKFLKQATYIIYVITNLSKFVQINKLTLTESFLEDSLKIKGPGTSSQATIFITFFDKKNIL